MPRGNLSPRPGYFTCQKKYDYDNELDFLCFWFCMNSQVKSFRMIKSQLSDCQAKRGFVFITYFGRPILYPWHRPKQVIDIIPYQNQYVSMHAVPSSRLLVERFGRPPLLELIKLNALRKRNKEKRRRKEKRKRRENLKTVKQRRKDVDSPNLTKEVNDFSASFQIIERREAMVLHPKVHHDQSNGTKSFCDCWVFSLHHSEIDVALLPCLFELKKCIHQVLSRKQIHILHQVLGSKPFCEFLSPYGNRAKAISDRGSLLIESQYRELILNWIPPPLQNLNTEFSDQQWLYNTRPLLNDTNQKISAASYDLFCYPYTTLF